MTNYTKKRKRQSGRQDCNPSERQRSYLKGYLDGQGELVQRLIKAGILPEVNFELKPKTFEQSFVNNEWKKQ